MNAPRYKTAERRQGPIYDSNPPLSSVNNPPAATPQQTLNTDDLGYRTAPQTVDWLPIDAAPRDGRALMLKPALDTAGPGTPAVWHRTRRWRAGKWQQAEFWGDPVTKWPLRFEPLFWRAPVYGEGIRR